KARGSAADDTRFHAADEGEMTRLAQAIRAYDTWCIVAAFARKYYGEQAATIAVMELGDYDDERWGYGEADDDQPFLVFDDAGALLSPDLTLPGWQDWIDAQIAYDSDMRARYVEHGWTWSAETPTGLRNAGWAEVADLRRRVNDQLCELRFALPRDDM